MKKNVLLVEDNNVNRMMLMGILGDDYNLVESENGWSGINMLSSESEKISAVLLDLAMPVMDGFDFLIKAKENPKTRHIPIIVISQTDDAATILRVLSMGALDLLSKPYNSCEIKYKLKNYIDLYEKI